MAKISPNSPTLLWLPPPLEEEVASSWLARIRHEHRLPQHTLFEAFAISKPVDLDISDLPRFFKKITHGVNVDKNSLSKMATQFISNRNNRKLNFIFNRDNKLQPFTSFCPDCLAESVPYWRYSWRLKFYRVCHVHGRPMRFRCQHCNGRQTCNSTNLKTPATLRKVALRFCCHCSKSLSDEKPLRAHKPEVIKRYLLIWNFLWVILTQTSLSGYFTRKNIQSSIPHLLDIFLEANGDPHIAEYRLLRFSLNNLAAQTISNSNDCS